MGSAASGAEAAVSAEEEAVPEEEAELREDGDFPYLLNSDGNARCRFPPLQGEDQGGDGFLRGWLLCKVKPTKRFFKTGSSGDCVAI